MNLLIDTIEKIRDTEAAILKIEQSLRDYPDHKDLLLLESESLYRRKEKLEEKFAVLADKEHMDVCNYRLIAEYRDRFTISDFSQALTQFQNVVSIVYDALINGPKERRRISPQSASESALEFAYTYSGSLGFMFTIPNERLLLVESMLDEAIYNTFRIAKATESEQILEFSGALGPAAVRSVYEWANSHVSSELSADIRWTRRKEQRAGLFVETKELQNLMEVIERTGEPQEQIIEDRVWLYGADAQSRSFHVRLSNDEEVRGYMDEAFKPALDLTLERYYVATLRKITTVHYALEQEDETYVLLDIKTTGA